MKLPTCALCHAPVDLESPFDGTIAINPNTLRRAIMHTYCLRVAGEDLA